MPMRRPVFRIQSLNAQNEEAFFSLARELFPRARIHLLDSDRVWLAYSGGEAAGFVHLRALPHSFYLQGIGVRPVWRRHGIGRRLLARAMAQAAQTGSPGGLILKVRAGNSEALAFYRSCGFMVERVSLSSWRLRWRSPN
ncbi:Mycothiol acetyltransferase [uncultured archaeon]|nr:Mycothiol acetyltransferase [uncultured archaeon]